MSVSLDPEELLERFDAARLESVRAARALSQHDSTVLRTGLRAGQALRGRALRGYADLAARHPVLISDRGLLPLGDEPLDEQTISEYSILYPLVSSRWASGAYELSAVGLLPTRTPRDPRRPWTAWDLQGAHRVISDAASDVITPQLAQATSEITALLAARKPLIDRVNSARCEERRAYRALVVDGVRHVAALTGQEAFALVLRRDHLGDVVDPAGSLLGCATGLAEGLTSPWGQPNITGILGEHGGRSVLDEWRPGLTGGVLVIRRAPLRATDG